MRNNMMPPQGGLRTDGQQVDPVSGNQVPVGSNAKEVRDDIPAQLSEGEYVVPADIVRYYGVKFFEDLRNQGKGGLNHMAATGRIGGEPVPPGGPQAGPMGQPMMAEGGDLTPDEMNELKSLMNVGGMAMQQQPMTDPYQQQSAMYQQPRGAAYGADFGGGSFYNNPGAITTPTRYTGEFSWEKPRAAPAPVEETPGQPVTLYCPDGTVNTLQLPADQGRYDELIQNGCGLDQSILPSTDEGSQVAETKGGSGEASTAWMEDYGYKGDGTESFEDVFQNSMDALDPTNRNFLERLLSGGAIGKLQQGMTAAQVAANIAILKANAETQEEKDLVALLTKEWNKYVKANNLDLLPPDIINGDQLAKQINATQVDWSLGRDSTDVNDKPLFDTDEEFYEQIEKAASDDKKGVSATYIEPGKNYISEVTGKTTTAPDTGVITYDYGDKTPGEVLGGEKIDEVKSDEGIVSVYKPTETTIRPKLRDDTKVKPEAATTSDDSGIDKNLLGGVYKETTDSGVNVYGTKEGTVRPKLRSSTSPADDLVATATKTTNDDAPKGIVGNNTTGKNTAAQNIANSLTPNDGKEYVDGVLVKTDNKPATTTTPKKDTSGTTVESVKTTNAVNRTGSDVTVGKTSAGGQDAGDGFVWEKKEGTNALTRKYVGTSNNNDSGGNDDDKDDDGGCCFIMLEARYGDGTMDEVVRRYRDEYMTDRNRRGYYRLAEVLVPLMRKSKAFKWVITKTFADPLVSYGKYYYGQNKHGMLYSPVKNFWMKVFDTVGGDTKFIRENGEVV